MAKEGFEPKLALGPFTRAELVVLVGVVVLLGVLLLPLRWQMIASAEHQAELLSPVPELVRPVVNPSG